MSGPANALQEGVDGARGSDLAHQIHIADVDAQLQGSRGHQHLQLAALQALLGVQAALLGQAAVMRGDMIFTDALGQMPRDTFDHPARIDEHQRGAMLQNQRRHPVVNLRPHLPRHHRLERRWGNFQRQIAAANMTAVDNGARNLMCAGQKLRNFFDRLLRCRQSNPRQSAARQSLQPFERQGQMCATLVARDGMDFIDDHGAAGREHVAAGLRTEQDVERFGRGHDDVRRAASHPGALGLRGVAGAHHRADFHIRQAQRREFFTNTIERRLEVSLDVIRQGLERRHVYHPRLVGQRTAQTLFYELVDRG